ncbi:hypothetical protein BQ8794_240215 [Mesorhizobium prunaredense]|uniref:Transposase for insertion sequence element IS21-like C-terminal domain-containing protein n=1 Tax=Mesorhizobium prunaredense TaxID=1631249 RepID=A0A1R3VC99_9HYPH|nr:hypothetical protein BQ8794_240215 [Mesorhizobium prunaredense]
MSCTPTSVADEVRAENRYLRSLLFRPLERYGHCRVAPDYHVEVDGRWYSTPYPLISELVDLRIADKTVEIFHKGQRIASQARPYDRCDHMPSAHRRYGKWTPGGLIGAGEKIGPATAAFLQANIADRPNPEQGFGTCLGILALTKSYGNMRVDAACRRGILYHQGTLRRLDPFDP